MTERARIAQREPRSLQPEQLGQLRVCRPAAPHSVHAWILWEDGVEERAIGKEQKPCRHTFSGTGWISSNGWPALS